jgi:hypothetical protein
MLTTYTQPACRWRRVPLRVRSTAAPDTSAVEAAMVWIQPREIIPALRLRSLEVSRGV